MPAPVSLPVIDPPHHPPISAGDHIVEMYRRTTVAPA